ncbi:hypothetical protein H4R33_002962 [Dimargaris cristalligena]|nr:hypothetical protein H4R33_002962 [Dimargaris cristalligena]
MVAKIRLSTAALVFLAAKAHSANINAVPDEILEEILGWIPPYEHIRRGPVSQRWNRYELGPFMRKTNKAEDEFFAHPESYNAPNLGPAEADTKLAAFMPLMEITVLPAFIHLIYQNLDVLGYDKLGQPLAVNRHPEPHVASNMILREALETFRPELQWLQKNTHVQQFDAIPESTRRIFFPFHRRLMEGKLGEAQTMSEYFLSASFGEALSRNFSKYVPESYIQFLATLLHTRQSVDLYNESPLNLEDYVQYAKNQEFRKARHMTIFLGYIMLLAGNSTYDTLYSAIGYNPATRMLPVKDHRLALLVASIQGNNQLAQALMDPRHVPAPFDYLGASAVQRGWISREQIPPTLAGNNDLNLYDCYMFMFRAIYPIHLDATGKTALYLYFKNPNPVDYRVPAAGPLPPPVSLAVLVNEQEVYRFIRSFMDEIDGPEHTPGTILQQTLDANAELGPPPPIQRASMNGLPPLPANAVGENVMNLIFPIDDGMPPNNP